MLIFFAFSVTVGGLIAFNWWVTRSEEKRAREWVASFHGEKLPPAETLRDKGLSTTFLLTVMPYYLEQGRREREKMDQDLKRDLAAMKGSAPCSSPR